MRVPLLFVPNSGQTDEQVQFFAKGAGLDLYCTRTEAVFVIPGLALSLQFAGADPKVAIEARRQAPGRVHRLVGIDPGLWARNLPTYEEIAYRELWPGIDLLFRSEEGHLKYDLILQPGASVAQIRFIWQGTEGLALDAGGNLQIQTTHGTLTDERPVSYQEIRGRRVPVAVQFALEGAQAYGFALAGEYDPRYPLVIDPGLRYSTFIGGIAEDRALGNAVDRAGRAYVAGFTDSINFPARVTLNPQPLPPTNREGFIAKLNPALSGAASMEYLTLIGGNGLDMATGVRVDDQGNAAFSGITNSTDLPTTPNAFQSSYQGGLNDAFVGQLDPTGAMLRYLSYVGSNGDDQGHAVAVDRAGRISITGQTDSINFPTGRGQGQDPVAQPSYGGGPHDGFVLRVDPNALISLDYSTYAGGSGDDRALAMDVDAAGSLWATGATNSPAAPVSLNPQPLPPKTFQGGPSDAFVMKLTPDGSAFENWFFLGGSGRDEGHGIAVDQIGNGYVTGLTDSAADFPRPNPGDPLFLNPQPLPPTAYGGGASDVFLVKVDPTASRFLFSTFYGGSGEDVGNAVAVDSRQRAYLTGSTTSPNLPITRGAVQPDFRGAPRDGFVAVIDTTARGRLMPVYSSYLGDGDTVGTGIAVPGPDLMDVAGFTNNLAFPTTANAFQRSYQGGLYDAFFVRIALPQPGQMRRSQPLFVSEGTCSDLRIRR